MVLPIPSGPTDRQKTAPGQLRRQGGDYVVPTDDASERHGQIVGCGPSIQGGRRRVLMLTGHRCDKGVTPAGVVGDVASARAAVAKRLAQRRDMDPERTFVDDRIGPCAGDEPILVDRLAGAFDERDQNIESAAAEAQRLPVIKQRPLSRNQLERSEGEGLFIHRENRPGNFCPENVY